MENKSMYILDGHTPVPEHDFTKWAKECFTGNNRRVAKTDTENGHVSTIFLGLDHNFGNGPPLLFETVVFGGDFDGNMKRYPTWDEAVEGHNSVVEKLRKNCAKRKIGKK